MCKLCGHESNGGIHQLKHIKGNVKKCYKATAKMKVEAKAALDEAKGKKIKKVKFKISLLGNKRPRRFGDIHKYVTFPPKEHIEVNGK